MIFVKVDFGCGFCGCGGGGGGGGGVWGVVWWSGVEWNWVCLVCVWFRREIIFLNLLIVILVIVL